MKSVIFAATIATAAAFAPSTPNIVRSSSTSLNQISREDNVDLGGNAWKPKSETMGVSSFYQSSLCMLYFALFLLMSKL